MNKVVGRRRTVLMVALEFPPCHSAGVQRTMKFAEYLGRHGWDVVVLTVHERVYERCDGQSLSADHILHVERCAALDAARDLAWRGKHFRFTRVPDRWWSWALSAIPAGKRLIEQFAPDLIWSTYPVATAHYIAARLQRWSGLPWVADYRDPLQSRYDPYANYLSSVARYIERLSMLQADRLVFTTRNAARLYQRLYPDIALAKFAVIENGYDESNFQGIRSDGVQVDNPEKVTLLHSGALYANGRDPAVLLGAIEILKRKGIINAENFELRFRGLEPSPELIASIGARDIADLVSVLPNIPYLESLREMMAASVLIIIQGDLFNNQVPGKAYEYLRASRPVLAVTPSNGATAEVLRNASDVMIANNEMEICDYLERVMREGCAQTLPMRVGLEGYTRETRTGELAEIFDQLCDYENAVGNAIPPRAPEPST